VKEGKNLWARLFEHKMGFLATSRRGGKVVGVLSEGPKLTKNTFSNISIEGRKTGGGNWGVSQRGRGKG